MGGVSFPQVESLTSQGHFAGPPLASPWPRVRSPPHPVGEPGKPARKPLRAGSMQSRPAVLHGGTILHPLSSPPTCPLNAFLPSSCHFGLSPCEVHSAGFPLRCKLLLPAPLIQSSSASPLRIGGQPSLGTQPRVAPDAEAPGWRAGREVGPVCSHVPLTLGLCEGWLCCCLVLETRGRSQQDSPRLHPL